MRIYRLPWKHWALSCLRERMADAEWSLGIRLACLIVLLSSVVQTYPQAKVEKEEHVESHVDL